MRGQASARPVAAGGARWIKLALRLAVPVLLLALTWHWLLRHADFEALMRQVRSLPAWAWLAAGAALVCGHSLRALRLCLRRVAGLSRSVEPEQSVSLHARGVRHFPGSNLAHQRSREPRV